MRVGLAVASAALVVGTLSACGGTGIDSGGINQTIPGTPCEQRGINIGESGTTTCDFGDGVVVKFNDTGVTLEGDPAQLPENCTLGDGAKWDAGQLQGSMTCTWSGASITYTPENGLQIGAAQPTPTA